jgi:hypothetical protein
MVIEAGFACLPAVIFLSPTGERDQYGCRTGGKAADLPCQIVAVQPGQADIKEGEIRGALLGTCQRGAAVVGYAYPVAEQLSSARRMS